MVMHNADAIAHLTEEAWRKENRGNRERNQGKYLPAPRHPYQPPHPPPPKEPYLQPPAPP